MNNSKILELFVVVLLLNVGLSTFNIAGTGKNGIALNKQYCNPQTTIDFMFGSSTTVTISGATVTLTQGSYSQLMFLDSYGNDMNMTLQKFSFEKTSSNFLTGISSTPSVTESAAYLFQFTSGSSNVFVYIPVVTGGDKSNVNLNDMTSNAIGSLSFSSTVGTPLTAFNLLDNINYNLWYTSVSGSNTILVSNFIYNIADISTATSTPSTLYGVITGIAWDSFLSLTGDRICYGSIYTTQNFQTHLRESVPLWFIFFFIFFYWLFYLISDSNTMAIYDKKFQNNRWTCMAIYSIYHLAHEEFFTRLTRLTIIIFQWTLQGVFLASIYGNQQLGAPMIIWAAAIAFVATIPFPFIIGSVFFTRIHEKNLIKYENQKGLKGIIDKQKIEPLEKIIDTCEQKLYGYYHWFYALFFCTFFICWAIAINQMQKLSRQNYHYHWYWLASMGICMVLEFLIFQPLLVLLFSDRESVRARGNYFYPYKLSEAYRAAQPA